MRSALLLLLAGCSTLNAARPLEPGSHAVGVTVGGAMVDLGAPVPLPNAVVEVQSGLTRIADRPLDLRVGLNATGLAFGLTQGHLGAAYLLARQRGAVPALSLSDRLFLAANVPGPPGREDRRIQGWGADQIEVTASWDARDHLVYVGMAQVFDFRQPRLLLCPSLGAQLDAGRGWSLQPELRWFGIGAAPPATTVRWATSRGALGVSVGVAHRFGGRP